MKRKRRLMGIGWIVTLPDVVNWCRYSQPIRDYYCHFNILREAYNEEIKITKGASLALAKSEYKVSQYIFNSL